MASSTGEVCAANIDHYEYEECIPSNILNIQPGQVTPGAYFVTDLGVDSIRMIEVLLHLEALGLTLTPDLAWRIQTVGDAYQYYQEQTGA